MQAIDLQNVAFARLDEYFGLWAMEAVRFNSAWTRAAGMDIQQHIQSVAEMPADTKPSIQVSESGVAIIRLSGVLMKQLASGEAGTSTIAVRKAIRDAVSNDAVSGILLVIDSPGGTVSGTVDLFDEIISARESKPVWAFIEDFGASAAYWCACACDVIFANNRTALVGSIGTIITLYDSSELLNRSGIKALCFATGDLKGTGVEGTAITQEQMAYMVSVVNQTQESFASAVKVSREMTQAQLKAVSSGRVWLADEAQALGLIDGIASIEEVVEAMESITNSGRSATSNERMNSMAIRDLLKLGAKAKAIDEEEEKKTPVAVDEVVEDDEDEEEKKKTPVAVDEVDEDDEEKKKDTLVASGAMFLKAFGSQGGVWFAQGKSFEEARNLYIKNLEAENQALKAKLDALKQGEPKALKLANSESVNTNKLSGVLGSGLSRFASGIKLPQNNK